MKNYILLIVAIAGASLSATHAMAALPDVAGQPEVLRLAQMDSPGDGLDGRAAVREGNARPYRLGSMGGRRARMHRYYRHRHHHRR